MIGAAYSLFVSSIESLAQKYDKYSTSWSDVEFGKREKHVLDYFDGKLAHEMLFNPDITFHTPNNSERP